MHYAECCLYGLHLILTKYFMSGIHFADEETEALVCRSWLALAPESRLYVSPPNSVFSDFVLRTEMSHSRSIYTTEIDKFYEWGLFSIPCPHPHPHPGRSSLPAYLWASCKLSSLPKGARQGVTELGLLPRVSDFKACDLNHHPVLLVNQARLPMTHPS